MSSTSWTRSEDKLFEQLLVKYPETEPDRWEKIASCMVFKSAEEVEEHFETTLLHDVSMIDAGLTELPNYVDEISKEPTAGDQGKCEISTKGKSWTEAAEHRLFLRGLQEYGKGDWRGISRYCVMTKTGIQVASHAQKYFEHQKKKEKKYKKRKRPSIHDITTVDTPQQ
ncbi:hypothetical protein QQ045_017346 [Rhodiola kirilowii]